VRRGRQIAEAKFLRIRPLGKAGQESYREGRRCREADKGRYERTWGLTARRSATTGSRRRVMASYKVTEKSQKNKPPCVFEEATLGAGEAPGVG